MKIFISILIIAGVAFGGYVYLQNKENNLSKTDTVASESTKPEEASEQPQQKKMAFSEFVKKDGSYECDVHATADFGSDGKVFLNNGDIRGDFSTIAEGISVDSSVLIKNGFTYVWSKTFPQAAVKIQNIETENSNSTNNSSGVYFWNAQQVGDYNCYPWENDETKFVIPTNITFRLIK